MFRKALLPLVSRIPKRSVCENETRQFGHLRNPSVITDHPSGLPKSFIPINIRNYAKGKDIKKEKKRKVNIYENELAEVFEVEKLFEDLRKPLDYFKKELTEHTTLRTDDGAIENLKIHFEGTTYNLQDLAEIGKKNPKFYILDLSSFPQVIPTVMATIQNSDFHVSVQQEGTKIFVPINKVTKEQREALARKAKTYFVKCKDSVKDVQMKYMRSLRKVDNLPEETKYRLTDQLSALGEKHVTMAEEILQMKQEELLKSE